MLCVWKGILARLGEEIKMVKGKKNQKQIPKIFFQIKKL